MPGRHHIRAHLLRHAQESIELDFTVAEHVGIGSPALGILVEHIIDDALAVLLAEIHEVEGYANLAGDDFSHVLVLLPLAVAVQGSVGIVPVLHKHSEHVVALLFEQQSGNAGVNASRKAYTNLHRLQI